MCSTATYSPYCSSLVTSLRYYGVYYGNTFQSFFVLLLLVCTNKWNTDWPVLRIGERVFGSLKTSVFLRRNAEFAEA